MSSASTGVEPTLEYFATLFAGAGVEWCIAGAVAANAYRAPRDTTDLDLIVAIRAPSYPALYEEYVRRWAAEWDVLERWEEALRDARG